MTAKRCEPPEHLRGKDGWHWVIGDHDGAELYADYWFAPNKDRTVGFWDNAGEPSTTTYRYRAPVPSPSDVDALVKAARKGLDTFVLFTTAAGTDIVRPQDYPVVVALRAALAKFEPPHE